MKTIANIVLKNKLSFSILNINVKLLSSLSTVIEARNSCIHVSLLT